MPAISSAGPSRMVPSGSSIVKRAAFDGALRIYSPTILPSFVQYQAYAMVSPFLISSAAWLCGSVTGTVSAIGNARSERRPSRMSSSLARSVGVCWLESSARRSLRPGLYFFRSSCVMPCQSGRIRFSFTVSSANAESSSYSVHFFKPRNQQV